MNLELHHVAILCDDLDESLRFYRDTLGLQIVTRFHQEGLVDMAILSDRSPSPTFMLALHGQPFSGWQELDYSEKGSHISALAFLSSDVDGWADRLRHTPLKLEEFPSRFLAARVLSVRDPSGVNVDLLDYSEPGLVPRPTSLSRSASGRSDIGMEFWLSSISLNCRNTSEVANEKRFYTEELCMALIRDNPDLAMLTDARADPNAGLDLFVSEPRLWEADGVFITERGPGLHYLCFGVRDLAAAHAALIQQGVECIFEPTQTTHYDIASYRDPSGIDLALSSTPWPQWGDGFKDMREAPHALFASG